MTQPLPMSPAWIKFIQFCTKLNCGEIDKLKVLNGVPVLAQKVMENTKFN